MHPAKKTAKPTIEDIKAYCIERRNKVDPEKFFDYYEANGWVQGKSGKPVRDWRACIRTWERNNFESNKKNQSMPDYMTEAYDEIKSSASLDETKAMLERMKK